MTAIRVMSLADGYKSGHGASFTCPSATLQFDIDGDLLDYGEVLVGNEKKLRDDGKDRDNEPRPLDVEVGYKLGAVPGKLMSA